MTGESIGPGVGRGQPADGALGERRLPPRRGPFVGRTAELGEVAARLGRYRLVTLVGVGGVGKTAIALEAARRGVPRATTAFFVDLVPCRSDDQVVGAFVDALGIRGALVAAGLDGVADALGRTRSLVVVDNCEHVLAGARAACDELLGRVAELQMLVTSRVALDVDGECVWRVPPMTMAAEDGPAAADGDAIALFVDRAAMAGAVVVPTAADVAVMADICRQAGGLPLAIELAANRLRVASLVEVAAGLAGSAWPAKQNPGRHASLEACLGWSVALLSPAAIVAFGRLSTFRGGFDAAAAAEVAGAEPLEASEIPSLIEELASASLLEVDIRGKRARYRFTEPVRQYAAVRLAELGEEESVRGRHARTFLARVEAVEHLLFEPAAEPQLDLLELDRADHDAALGWLLDRGAVEEAQRLGAALYFFWYTRGHFVSGLDWLRKLLMADAVVGPMVRLRSQLALAQLAFIAGDYVAAFVAIEEVVPAARQLADDLMIARSLALAGYVWWFADPGRSAALFQEAIDAASRVDDGFAGTISLAGLGWARYFTGGVEGALEPLDEAIAMTARSGRRQQFGMAVLGRAAVELRLGRLAAAEASAAQALGSLRAVGDATWTSVALAVVAEIERAQGRLNRAELHAVEAVTLAEQAGSAINTMVGCGHRGRILLARGDPTAAGLLATAVQLGRSFAVRPILSWWLDSLGELAELEGRHDDARHWYQQAIAHALDSGLTVDSARARHHLGRLAWVTGDLGAAVNGCHDALATQLAERDPLGMLETMETLGGVLDVDGRPEQALMLLAAAHAARETLGFPLRPMETQRVGAWIASARRHLGAESGEAWQRGAAVGLGPAAAQVRRGRGPRRRPSFGWDSLTPAEMDVARLVADGLTNREIAAQLGVSPATVKEQVSSALRKLGARTRAQLAAVVSGHTI